MFRVIILSAEADGSFFGHVVKVPGANKGEALLDALVSYAMKGGDLNKVARTRVTEIKPEAVVAPTTNRTMLGLAHVSP